MADSNEARDDGLGALPTSLRFYYIKSPTYRVLHIDGAIGGITPKGLIHCAVYSERPAIPREQEFSVEDGLRLGRIVATEGKVGIVREIEADLMMDKRVVRELRDWLDKRLADIDVAEIESSEGKSDAV
jgi:hypothetical protein